MCESAYPLRIVVDTSDISEAASVMICEDEHRWAEPRFPRSKGVEFFVLLVDCD